MLDYFQDQIYVESFYIVFNIIAKYWLVIFLGYKFSYFLDTKMAYK